MNKIKNSPWQKCLLSPIKRASPFYCNAVCGNTRNAHLKQHCTRGGEGGEFIPFGHDGCMVRNWKLHWNVSTVLSGVVVFKLSEQELKYYLWGKSRGILKSAGCGSHCFVSGRYHGLSLKRPTLTKFMCFEVKHVLFISG